MIFENKTSSAEIAGDTKLRKKVNKFSIILFFIMANLVGWGGLMIYAGNLWGIIPFLLGGIMILGFKGPKSTTESPTKKVWLITFLGKPTETVARSLTLILDWPWDIVGYIEVDMKVANENFDTKKPIFCPGDKAYVTGKISVAMSADDQDGIDPTTGIFKSGGEKLQEFNSIGGLAGAKMQLDDILTSWLQDLARADNYTTEFMELSGIQIAIYLKNRVMGYLINIAIQNGSASFTNATGFGLKFPKFEVILQASEDVIKARNNTLVEDAQRITDAKDIDTNDHLIQMRIDLHRRNKNMKITTDQVRQEILEEKALNNGDLKIVLNPKGINVANVPQKP